MAYYYTLDNDRYFLRWSVGTAFSGCSVLPDSVDVPEPLRTCACNVRAYRYAGGIIAYDPDRESVTDDDSAAGGGTVVQADLAQNDAAQKDYVKNRTHWKEEIPNEVVTAERTLSFSIFSPHPTFSFFSNLVSGVGYNFLVTWDGVIYRAVSTAGNDDDIYLGDYSLVDSSHPAADYPFCLVWKLDSRKVTAYNSAYNGTTLNTKVYVEQIGGLIYHKLDEEFSHYADCFASVEGGGTALILVSPNGTRYAFTVDDAGSLCVSAVTE